MKNLSGAQQKEWAAITTGLDAARDALMPLVTHWNEVLEEMESDVAEGDDSFDAEKHWEESDTAAIEAAWTAWTDAMEAVQSFAENIRDEAQSYYDEKSERWQEGEKGEEYNLFIESWSEIADMEIPELSDMIDDVTGEISEPDDSDTTGIPAAQMFPGQ